MTQLSFALEPRRRVADTSVVAYRDLILPALTRKEIAVYRALAEMCAVFGDATGGELTERMRSRGQVRDCNGTRPRLSDLFSKGWVTKGEPRRCRAYTTTARPYRPVVPLEALHDLNPDDGGR